MQVWNRISKKFAVQRVHSRERCRSWRVEEPETMPPAPPGALIPNTCPKYIVEQSFENTKAVGVATVHSAMAIGTTTN